MNPFRNRKPVFEANAFYGRKAELDAICRQLSAQPPQCCAVVGLPRSGKTSLLYHLQHQAHLAPDQRRLTFGGKEHVLAVYVNAGPYVDFDRVDLQGALYFWREFYNALAQVLAQNYTLLLPAEPSHGDLPVLDQLHTIRQRVAAAIHDCPAEMVLLLLDNAEGIAALPRLTGSLLRTLTQDPTLSERVAYVATSQVPMHQLYEPATWQIPSSFWNLFATTIYLGQLDPAAADALMVRGTTLAARIRFGPEEQALLLRIAGRHPELLTTACALLYDRCAEQLEAAEVLDEDAFARELFAAARPLCQAIWQSLANIPGAHDMLQRVAQAGLPFLPSVDDQQTVLAELVRQGVVDKVHESEGTSWRIAAAIMHQFVDEITDKGITTERTLAIAPPPRSVIRPEAGPGSAMTTPAFTHLEGAVYDFLTTHAGTVCEREQIKQAVWDDDFPSDSALQKLIERIREKIEADPKHPRRLLAVRGQGYILYPESTPR